MKRIGLIQVFMDKAREGLKLWANMLVPAIVFGYVVVQILDFTGLMQVIGVIFSPLLGLFGLPGEAATPIITAYMTLPAGCAAAAAMVNDGTLTTRQVTVLFPMMYCVASHLLYIGRVLGASGVAAKRYPVYLGIGVICSLVSGALMHLFLA